MPSTTGRSTAKPIVLVKINTKTGETKGADVHPVTPPVSAMPSGTTATVLLPCGLGFAHELVDPGPDCNAAECLRCGLQDIQHRHPWHASIGDQLVIRTTMDAPLHGVPPADLLRSEALPDPIPSLFNCRLTAMRPQTSGNVLELYNSCPFPRAPAPGQFLQQKHLHPSLVRSDQQHSWTLWRDDQRKDEPVPLASTRSAPVPAQNLMVFNDYLYIGEYNDEEHAGAMFRPVKTPSLAAFSATGPVREQNHQTFGWWWAAPPDAQRHSPA